MSRHRVALGEAELSVLSSGEGEALVLLHGIPTGAELWRDVLIGLARAGWRGLAPDLPGYGKTHLPADGDYSLRGSAALLASWLVQAQLAPAWIVGHDAGGAVAQILAARHPDCVARLTLTNSIVDGYWPAPRARLATTAARLGLYRKAARVGLVPNAFMRREIRRAFADSDRAAAVDTDRVVWDSKVSSERGRMAFERHLAALTRQDTAGILPQLREIRVPCQLIWGMADAFQPWRTTGMRLASVLPSPAVAQLDGCGHFTPWECPERFLAALLDWPVGSSPRGLCE